MFRKRDLSHEELLDLELDGTYLRYHQGAEKKEPILVATGYRADGTAVLLHIGVGNRESYENWKGFLQETLDACLQALRLRPAHHKRASNCEPT